MPNPLAVILAKPEDPPADALARIFAEFHGVTAFDGKRLANHAWGFLGEKLSESGAEKLKALADAAGLPVHIKEEKDIPALPPALNLHRAWFDEYRLYYTTGSSPKEHSIACSDLALACAVGLREETSFVKTIQRGPSAQQRAVGLGLSMVTGIPISLGKKQEVKKTVKSAEFYLYIDLFSKDLSTRLHVDAQQFNFLDLQERMLPNAMGNFKTLLQDLATRAPAALKNRAARMILASQPYASMGYETRGDYEKECRWLLALCQKTA